jgi:hypothetical protein
MSNEKQLPNLDALANAGSNAAKPHAERQPETPIDLSSVGGKLIASPQTASGPVDLSSCYGETGRALDEPETG